MIKVYAKIQDGVITAINSSAFLSNSEGWIEIDHGNGDRFVHAQSHYLPNPLMDEFGRYHYKLTDGGVVERTEEEMDELPAPEPS